MKEFGVIAGIACLAGLASFEVNRSMENPLESAMPAPPSLPAQSLPDAEPIFTYQCGIAFDNRLPQQFKDANCQATSLLPRKMQSYVNKVVLHPKDEMIDDYIPPTPKYLSIISMKRELRIYPNTLKSAIIPTYFIHEYCHVLDLEMHGPSGVPINSEFGRAYYWEKKMSSYAAWKIGEGFAEACAKTILNDPVMQQHPWQWQAMANILNRL
jgi:hypothetical protein